MTTTNTTAASLVSHYEAGKRAALEGRTSPLVAFAAGYLDALRESGREEAEIRRMRRVLEVSARAVLDEADDESGERDLVTMRLRVRGGELVLAPDEAGADDGA